MTSAATFRRRTHAPGGAALMLGMPQLPDVMRLSGPPRPAGGFGLTMDQVLGSGTGELVERYSASIVPDRFPDPRGRFDVTEWMPFTEQQYAQPGFPFTDPRSIGSLAWVPGWDATHQRAAAVPAALVYLGALPEPQWCTVTSNGLAAGRTAGAAARGALHELVERDAFFRTWYGGDRHPTLRLRDLLSSPSPGVDAVTLRYAEHVVACGVDVTFVRLPAATPHVSVVAACARSSTVGLAVGCGAKGSASDALRSALIESVQTYAWAAELNSDAAPSETGDGLEDHVAYHADPSARDEGEFLDAGDPVPPREFLASDPADLSTTIGSLVRAGWRVLFADAASSDVRRNGWHVVRALSPSAATLDVGPIHEAQHSVIRNRAPHPFP